MEKHENSHKVKFLKIVCFILVILMCAVPCSAVVSVYPDQTVNIDYGVDFLIVYNKGTANLHPGAEINSGGMALSGSTINFYGGQMLGESYITAFSNIINPKITVHGRNFAVNGETLDPSQTSFDLDFTRPYHTLTGFYGNGDEIDLDFRGNITIYLVVLEPESGMEIDIKPGDEQNNVNLKSNGVVPVAVLTTDQFDAATIDPATAQFAGAAPKHWSLEDVDGDGDDDVMFHFRTQELDLTEDSTEATLTAQLMSQRTMLSAAQTSSGAIVSGTDTVRIVTAKKSKK
jgi:hypothetical protein